MNHSNLILALVAVGCSVGCGSGSSKSDTADSPTVSDTSTGSVDSSLTPTADTALSTGDSADSGGPTGDSAAPCDVVARDDTVRDCLDDVVFCDVSPENAAIQAECAECFGGDLAWLDAWLSAEGTTSYDAVWQECQDVALPDRPETCSALTQGVPSADASPRSDLVGWWYAEGSVECQWDYDALTLGGALPVRLDATSLPTFVRCTDTASGKVVDVPAGAEADLGIAGTDLWLRDAYDGPWLGLYGTDMVADHGCQEPSGAPPDLELEVIGLDPSLPALTEVTCQLADCPAKIRGEPAPP